MTALHRPDDPGICICPTCNRPWPDDDADVERFLRKNAGRVEPEKIARWVQWSLRRLNRFATRKRIDITFRPEKEREPVGA